MFEEKIRLGSLGFIPSLVHVSFEELSFLFSNQNISVMYPLKLEGRNTEDGRLCFVSSPLWMLAEYVLPVETGLLWIDSDQGYETICASISKLAQQTF